MYHVNLLVIGPYQSGKSALINTIKAGESGVFTVDDVDFEVAQMDQSELPGWTVHLYESPGARRFDNLVKAVGIDGFIVMLDSARPETFREAKSIIETFNCYPEIPFVVAANKQDKHDAWDVPDLRLALRLKTEIPVIPCIATKRDQVKNVIWELLFVTGN